MGETTLRQALEDYKSIYMAYRNFADRTRVEYLNDLRDLVEFAEKTGIEKVGGLGLPIIQRFVANLEEKGFSSLTRKRKVVAIRSFLSFLYENDYILTNIASKVIIPFTETTTPYVLTQSECGKLRMSCAGNIRDKAIIELLLGTGIRLSELTRLTLNDIDLAGERGVSNTGSGSIRILGGRAKKERIIPLTARACTAIGNYLAERKGRGNNILFLNRFGEPLGERGVQKMLRKCLRAAGIGGASIHTLRHTFGAQQIGKGTSLKAVRELMGHRDIRSTSAYLSLAGVVRQEDR